MSQSPHLHFHSILTPPFSHNDMRVIHHRDVRPETIKRYARVISCLVFLVLRFHRGWEGEYSMALMEEQSDAPQALLEVLLKQYNYGSGGPDKYEADLSSHDIDDRDHLNDQDEPLDDPDGEVHDDVPLFNNDHPLSPIPEAIEEIEKTPVQARLLELLLSLYTHLPSGRDDKFWSPIIRFIVLYSIKKDGRWLPARQITQIFAALLFCGRLLMMVLMHWKVLRDPSLRHPACVKPPCV
jgi:hypothetical protein